MAKSEFPYGLGRRKTAIAQAQLLKDSKDMTVNGTKLDDYFSTVDMKTAALSPLRLTSQDESYGLRLKVRGGGKRAQADAAKMAIARALLQVDQGFRKQLKEAGMLKRDSRKKERKKFGLKRARRAPQFSKR